MNVVAVPVRGGHFKMIAQLRTLAKLNGACSQIHTIQQSTDNDYRRLLSNAPNLISAHPPLKLPSSEKLVMGRMKKKMMWQQLDKI
jgi:hypothetical protein